MDATVNIPDYNESQLMDFLVIIIMLLFAALLFVSFTLPAINSHASITNVVTTGTQ